MQFLRGNVADKGITALHTVSQIGPRIPRRSPAVQVVLFQFFLFEEAACYFPGARAPDRLYWCPQAKHNRARKNQIQVLGFTENVWSVTCMRYQQRA